MPVVRLHAVRLASFGGCLYQTQSIVRRPKESKALEGRKKAVYSLHPDDHPDDYSKQSYYDTPDPQKLATAEPIIQ
jgi:hypothetical protein